jgi:hypothetical protein
MEIFTVKRGKSRHFSNLNSLMFLKQKNYVNYWESILECLKNVSPENPIKILKLKIISENHGKIYEKLHVLLACL